MSSAIHIPAHERGLVRIFSLSMTQAEAKALRDDPDALFAILRGEELNTGHVEVFPLADLSELGLIGYLETGCGIAPETLAPDRPKLAALEGWVMLVFSRAFNGAEQTIHPMSDLTLIGTYAEPGVDWTPPRPLVSEAATGSTAPTKKTPSDAAMSGRIATLALLVLFAVTGLMIWVAG